MLTLTDIFLLVGIVFVGAAAQLCLKKGADAGKTSHFLQSFFQPWVLIGVTLMITNMLALVWVLRYLPLTLVMPATSLIYVFVPSGAMLLFKERLQTRFWFGALLIVVGIMVIAAGRR